MKLSEFYRYFFLKNFEICKIQIYLCITHKGNDKETLIRMISQSNRSNLMKRVDGRKGDYRRAAQIYLESTGISIGSKYLYYFLRGERKVNGTGRHLALNMFEAIAKAVNEREMNERAANEKAAQAGSVESVAA